MVQPSRPGKRGGRVVTNAGRDAVDANVPIDERRASRTGKSCGPGAPMQAPSLREGLRLFEDDRGNKLVHRGEREVSRKALRSEGRSDSACTCGQRAHAQDFSCACAVGAAGTRPSLRPRQCQRVSRLASLGRIPSRERGGLPSCLKNRIWKSGIVIARCIAPTSPPKRVRREGGSNPECHAVKVGIASLPPSLIELRRTSRSQ